MSCGAGGGRASTREEGGLHGLAQHSTPPHALSSCNASPWPCLSPPPPPPAAAAQRRWPHLQAIERGAHVAVGCEDRRLQPVGRVGHPLRLAHVHQALQDVLVAQLAVPAQHGTAWHSAGSRRHRCGGGQPRRRWHAGPTQQERGTARAHLGYASPTHPTGCTSPATPTHLTMAHLLWMGSMILEDWLHASAKRVVEE